jgi:hypothetical protein
MSFNPSASSAVSAVIAGGTEVADKICRDDPIYAEISDVSTLKPGDHISFPVDQKLLSILGCDHHAIVASVFDNAKLLLIHFTVEPIEDATEETSSSVTSSSGTKSEDAAVKQQIVDVSKYVTDRTLRKYEYENCLSVEDTLKAASAQIGRKGYNLVTNNCEHFAIGCKTGKGYSTQVIKTMKTGLQVGAAAVAGAFGGLVTAPMAESKSEQE